MKSYTPIVVCILGGALILGGLSLILYFGQWHRFGLLTASGFFAGLVLVPEFSPKILKYPALYQSISGSVAGALVGVVVLHSVEGGAIGLVVGAITGWLTPWWAKHLTLP